MLKVEQMINIGLMVIAVLLIIYLFRRIVARPKGLNLTVRNQQLQVLYDQRKYGTADKKVLSLKEKIELSWAFLTNITEQVLNKFSLQDQQQVDAAGKILADNGMCYKHNVEQVNFTAEVIREQGKDQDKGNNVTTISR